MSISSSRWQSGKQTGLVSLGTHCVYLAADGPQRLIIEGRLQPAVIIEAGLCSGLSEWVAVSLSRLASTAMTEPDMDAASPPQTNNTVPRIAT